MSHERPVHPFSDLHREGDHVRATLLHDPTVEGLDMAMYIDGSGSMADEYTPSTKIVGGFWKRLFGGGEVVELPNVVTPEARKMLAYLATKDWNGKLRVAYWATANGVEHIGDFDGRSASTHEFNGPREQGSYTMLAPALHDFVDYMKVQAKAGARQGCAVIVTDGQIHDADKVKKLSGEIADKIARGQLPRMNFVLVGVGSQIDEEQMEAISHLEHVGVGHMWCHRVAAEMKDLPELVAVLVDETMTVAAGGTVYDQSGTILKVYEGRLPAVLEFEVPEGTRSFVLEVNGQRFEQPIPEEEHHDDEDEDEDHH